MGLSSKQVSDNRVDWNQNQARELGLTKSPQVIQQQEQQQQLAPLNCPRCDSTNTKFCYYNNYNRSQPRHYCKSCKRHWTKGGTLRNVPVGGGRKNKRLKTSNNNSHHGSNTNITIQPQQKQQQQLPLALGEQKSVSEILCQALLHPPLQPNYIKHESNNDGSNNNNNNNNNNNSFLGTTLSLLPISNFPFTTGLSNFNSNCCLIPGSFQSTNVYNYTGEIPTTSISMDSSNYWSWDDLSEFIPNDLKQTWDESQQQ